MRKATLILLACALLLCGRAYGAGTPSFTVTFLENQTAGYTWFYQISDEAVLAVADLEYQAPEETGGLVGVGGTHTWTISGLGAGEASVSFYYAWAWTEELTEPDVTYTFASDGAGGLAPVSIVGLPEQYMPGKVAVRLKENPTTGYQWSMETDVGGILLTVGDAYAQDPAPANAVGVGGVHTWIFDIAAEGSVVLTFRYARSFEPGGSPAATVTLTYLVDQNLDAALMGLDGDYEAYLAEMP